jgi:hypothetical protein
VPIALIVIAALCFILDRQFSRWQKDQTRAWAKAGLVLLRICVWLSIVSALLSALLELVMNQKEASKEVAKGPIILNPRPQEIRFDSPYRHSHRELYLCALPAPGYFIDNSPPAIVSARGRGRLQADIITSNGVRHRLDRGTLRSGEEGTFLCLGAPEGVTYEGDTYVSAVITSDNEVIVGKLRIMGHSPK